jgi:hypothetical protein
LGTQDCYDFFKRFGFEFSGGILHRPSPPPNPTARIMRKPGFGPLLAK